MRLPPSLLAAGLGGVSVFGFAPFELFPLPILTLALLFRLWQQAEPGRAAWLGFCWGAGFFLAGVSWVYISLHDMGGMAAPLAAVATLLFCAYLALFPALVGYLYRRAASADNAPAPAGRHFWRDALLLAGLWTLAEWLRGWAFTGFPWLALGYSQAPPSPLAGYAAVLGVFGVGFVAVLFAALLALDGRRRAGWGLIVLLLAAGAALRQMDWTQPTGAPLRVALLQGNVPQSIKWVPEYLSLSIDTYTRLALDHPADLTVLPETAIPLFFDQIPRETLAALGRHGNVLIGAAARHREGGYVNAAIALTPEGTQSYAKQHLVPFGEYAPPGFSWFFELVNIPMSDFSAGPPGQSPLAIAGQRIAPNICYEDLFGEEIIRALPEATLLINLSNTAWFGDSLAQPQHLQIARLRALETGRMMLRATNTGITAAIAPDGRVLAQLPEFVTGALVVEAQGFTGLTPYAQWGNALAVLIAAAAVFPGFLHAYRRRRSR
ncbi:MAG: apolipoprotein N-acyltransferase [Sulfuritalea sp.]|nr:apolipoprotein N-acyltransferase [Sulfuritalea sp.]